MVAVVGNSYSERMRSQRAVFTLHRDLSRPLQSLSPSAVRKFTLPKSAHDEAQSFLQLAGVNEFSVFPDLDGLARYIHTQDLKTDTQI